MIIKEIHINAFGGLKNKSIKFAENVNVVYGENESGKSTLQNFIKIWLYGFSSYKGKNILLNERIKYTPITGESISGKLIVESNNKEYAIIRTFGKSKKDDTVKVLDNLSGEDLSHCFGDEPGKKILGISRATFIKTLFIGQLEVMIKKDKEEELLNRITNIIGSDDEKININKVFDKLEEYKKNISNNRKKGQLDLYKEKKDQLLQEKLEGYKLSKECLIYEEQLTQLKDNRNYITTELSNLEIYKKNIKGQRLQKDYKKLTVKNLKGDILENLHNENIENNLKGQIEQLKFQAENYEDKLNKIKKLKNEIEVLNIKKKTEKESLGKVAELYPLYDEITQWIKIYEEKLKEQKGIIEIKNNKEKNITMYVAGSISLVSLFLSIILKSIWIKIILINIAIIAGVVGIGAYFISEKGKKNKYNTLKKEIVLIEDNLDIYRKIIDAKDYVQLFKSYNTCREYRELEERFNKIIQEKKVQISFLEQDDFYEKYESINKKIKTILNKYQCDSLEVLIEKFYEYDKKIQEQTMINLQIEDEIDNTIKEKNNQLLFIEKEIKDVENKINNRFIGKRSIAEIEEDLNNINLMIIEEEKKYNAVILAKEAISEAYDEIRNDFRPMLNKVVTTKLNNFNEEKNESVLVSDDYEINIVKNNMILNSTLMSNGAQDQIYLALRLAFIEMIFENKNTTIYFDDAFVQYDNNRLKKVLMHLLSEKFKQIIIFTCQNRESQILKENHIIYNYIEL